MQSEVTYSAKITPAQIAVLAEGLRIPERDDFLRSFPTVEVGIEYCWRSSKFARLILLGDEPVAVFGIADDDGVQVPWLVMTTVALMEHPVRIMREAKRCWEAIRAAFPGTMMNYVPVEDTPAQNMIEVLGFEVHRESVVLRGEHEYYVFWMKGA